MGTAFRSSWGFNPLLSALGDPVGWGLCLMGIGGGACALLRSGGGGSACWGIREGPSLLGVGGGPVTGGSGAEPMPAPGLFESPNADVSVILCFSVLCVCPHPDFRWAPGQTGQLS